MLKHENHTVGDVRIHYVIEGQGPALLLIHGFPQTWYCWHKVIPALAEHFTVIAPDLRGLGFSSRPRDGYDKTTVMEDLRSIVTLLGFDQVAVAGHDIGAHIAFKYAAVHPDEVTKLVLMDALILGTPQWMDLRDMPWTWHINFQDTPDLPEMLVAGKERMYARYFLSRALMNPATFTREDLAVYEDAFEAPGAARAMFEHYRSMTEDEQDNQRFFTSPLKTRTLQMGGALSQSSHMQEEMIRGVFDEPRFTLVEGAGHWLAEEAPDAVVRELLDFLV